jgi:hypothetical protein
MDDSTEQLSPELERMKNQLLQAMDDKDRIMVDILKQEMEANRKMISHDIADLLSVGVLPQIDDHETRIVTLENKTKV